MPGSAGGDGPVPRHAGEPRRRHRAGPLLPHGDRRLAGDRQDAGGPADPGHAEPGRRERTRTDGPPSGVADGSLRSRPGARPAVGAAGERAAGRVELGRGERRSCLEAEGGRNEGSPAHGARFQSSTRGRVHGDLVAHRPAGRRLVAARVRRRGRSLGAGIRHAQGIAAPPGQGQPDSGLGAEFLDRPGDGFERDFAARRSPDQPAAGA